MIHYFVSEAEGVRGASVPGNVATLVELLWVAMFGPTGLVEGVSGVTVVVACRDAPPRSVDRSWLSCFVAPGRSMLAWGCWLVCGLVRHFIPATRWPVSLILCW